MSHITVCKTKITNPNSEIVKQAMQALAQIHSAKLLVNTTVQDRYGNITADYILQMPNGRYIGFKIGDKLEVVGDPYDWRDRYNQLVRQIQQYYNVYASLTVLQQMGYRVSTVQKAEQGIYVEVVR